MVPGLFSAWTTGSSNASDVTPDLKKPSKVMQKSLPAITYRDEQFYELERRAIFSKCWILVSHSSRFAKPGDFLAQTYAGFSYFIIMDKDGTLRAHHNVCRHRAFPVVNKAEGSTSILACKYHSWSYRYDGSLIKAPKFDSQPLFNKEENGLFPIHIHVTDKGFIFLNFSAETPVPFEKHFGDLHKEWSKLPVDEYEYAYSWSVTGKYNWKTLMDGYQECYHCTVGHPGFAKTLDLGQYKVIPFTNFARHQVPNSNPEDENPPSFTFTFPNTGVTTCPEMWYMMRCVPVNARETRMEYDVFRHKSMGMAELREFMKFYEQVEVEDFDLCEATQRGLEAGVYSKGILHPDNENGVLYYQSTVLDYVLEHRRAEDAAGREIHPARPASQSADASCAASKICSDLHQSKSLLAW